MVATYIGEQKEIGNHLHGIIQSHYILEIIWFTFLHPFWSVMQHKYQIQGYYGGHGWQWPDQWQMLYSRIYFIYIYIYINEVLGEGKEKKRFVFIVKFVYVNRRRLLVESWGFRNVIWRVTTQQSRWRQLLNKGWGGANDIFVFMVTIYQHSTVLQRQLGCN